MMDCELACGAVWRTEISASIKWRSRMMATTEPEHENDVYREQEDVMCVNSSSICVIRW